MHQGGDPQGHGNARTQELVLNPLAVTRAISEYQREKKILKTFLSSQ